MVCQRIVHLDIDAGFAVDHMLLSELSTIVMRKSLTCVTFPAIEPPSGVFTVAVMVKPVITGSGGPNPVVLKLVGRAEFSGDVVERAGAVARGAMSRNIGLPLSNIADENVLDLIGAAVGDVLHLKVNELGNVSELVVGYRGKRRHRFFRPAHFQEWNKFFAMLVIEHKIGSNEGWPFGAASLRSVAKCAVLLEKRRSQRCAQPCPVPGLSRERCGSTLRAAAECHHHAQWLARPD